MHQGPPLDFFLQAISLSNSTDRWRRYGAGRFNHTRGSFGTRAMRGCFALGLPIVSPDLWRARPRLMPDSLRATNRDDASLIVLHAWLFGLSLTAVSLNHACPPDSSLGYVQILNESVPHLYVACNRNSFLLNGPQHRGSRAGIPGRLRLSSSRHGNYSISVGLPPHRCRRIMQRC